MRPLESIGLAEIRAARERIAAFVLRTPILRLNVDDAPAEIHLKLENLQPIGSFKLRGAGNAMAEAGAAVSTSQAKTRVAGFNARTAEAIPEDNPPPP